MKYSAMNQYLGIFLILLYTINCNLITYSNSNENLNSNVVFDEKEAKFFAKYAKLSNCASKPLAKSCPTCLKPTDGYKFFFYFQTTRLKKFNYKLMIHYNDADKKVLVTFGGPGVENHNYIKYIYAKGFSMFRLYRINIEKEFHLVYFSKIRSLLTKKIKDVKKSGRNNYQFNFAGYSLGGSIATLAAFDLSKQKIISNPHVYTYGGLRIGDATFVTLVNTYVRVWRVVKANDYIVRIPNCYFSPTFKVWRCFSQPIIRKFIMEKTFPLKLYVRNYITLYRKNNSVLMRALRVAKQKGFTNQPTIKQYKRNEKKKKSLKKTIKRIKKAAFEKIKRKSKHVITLKPKRKNRKNSSMEKFKKLKAAVKKHIANKKAKKIHLGGARHKKAAHKKVAHKKSTHKKSAHKNETHKKAAHKKAAHQNSSHKKSAHKKSAHKIEAHKKAAPKKVFRKIKNIMRRNNLKRMNAKLTKFSVWKSLKNKRKSQKKVLRIVRAQMKKKALNKRNNHRRSYKAKKSIKAIRKAAKNLIKRLKKTFAKLNKSKKQTPQIKKKEIKKKQTEKTKVILKPLTPAVQDSPIKKIVSQSTKKFVSPKIMKFTPYIAPISIVSSFSPIQVYFKYIYYTQPIGYEIYYDDGMTSYKTCQYVNGIASCERYVSLPASFTIDAHHNYYGIDFDKCSA